MKKTQLRKIIRESIKELMTEIQLLNEKSKWCSCKETINGVVTKFKCMRKSSPGSGCGCCKRFKEWQEGDHGPSSMVGPTGDLPSGERIAEGCGCSGGQITEKDEIKNTCEPKGTEGKCKGGCDGSCKHNHWINVGRERDAFMWCDCKGKGSGITDDPTLDGDEEKLELNEKFWWNYHKCKCEGTMMMPDGNTENYKMCCGGSGAPCSSRWDCPKTKKNKA